MPKLLTREVEDSLKQPEPCNLSAPAENVMVEQQVPIEEFKERCDRYLKLLSSLQLPQQNTMVRAANFTTESVLQMIQSSPGSSFIRVYYGIDANGEHGLFMAPISEAGSLDTNEETVYVDDCCACPPLGNCQDDPLLNP